jgi:hypothetical protein
VEALDRYLQAVSSWLPRGQEADVVAELAEDIRSEVDDRERQLGRALAEEELLALLERRGHPMWVAERFLPGRYLIGPAMLPAYWRAVKIAVACIFVIFVALFLIFSGPARQAVPMLSGPGTWVWLFGVWSLAYVGLFTLIFAFVERRHARARVVGRWDPRDPDGLPHATSDPDAAARRSLRVDAIAEVAADLLTLAWWLGVHVPAIPELGIVLTPMWRALHWPIALLLAGSLAVAVVDAIRPSWSRPRLVARLAVDAYALLLTGILLSAWPWVQVTATSVIPQAHADRIELWMNVTWMSVLLVIGAVCARRVMRLERRMARGEVLPPRLLAGE